MLVPVPQTPLSVPVPPGSTIVALLLVLKPPSDTGSLFAFFYSVSMRKLKKSTALLKWRGEVWYKKGTVGATTSHSNTPFFDSIYRCVCFLEYYVNGLSTEEYDYS